jgi:RNA polymerase sigma-70 factor (ECF subfamily)
MMQASAEKFDPQTCLTEARNGCDQAVAQLLDYYRPYLTILARLRTNRQLQAKYDDSDLVQDTLVLVHRNLPKFRGTTEAEFTVWLRTILASVSSKFIRRYSSQRREMMLERQLENEFSQSSDAVGNALVSLGTSPSERSIKRERAVILSQALTQLPSDYREAMILHRFEGLTMAEVADRMGRSVDSVQKLLARGLLELRRLLEGKL